MFETSRVSVIASHSSLRHLTPGYERNVSDEMLESLAQKGRVLMINFGSFFVTDAARRNHERECAARDGSRRNIRSGTEALNLIAEMHQPRLSIADLMS